MVLALFLMLALRYFLFFQIDPTLVIETIGESIWLCHHIVFTNLHCGFVMWFFGYFVLSKLQNTPVYSLELNCISLFTLLTFFNCNWSNLQNHNSLETVPARCGCYITFSIAQNNLFYEYHYSNGAKSSREYLLSYHEASNGFFF